MTGPVAMFTTELGAGLVLIGAAIVNDSGRTAVLGLAGVVTIASARWLWGAIVRQIKAAIIETNGSRYDELEASIDALAARSDVQHAENGRRLDGIEQRQAVVEANTSIHAKRLDDSASQMASIFTALTDLASHIADLRGTQLATTPEETHHAS